ncbi:hypothetical protein AB1L42_19300 [Thalassoglobus sp. JC818]|uniref:hypothetical protein n=1 Tax=Thalassoglobus sp. JC818 TaxID=3232136 RepID=UPI00345AD089
MINTAENTTTNSQRVADPTPAEIRERCKEIQAGWTAEERERRWVGGAREDWTVPQVRAVGFGKTSGEDV